MFWDIAGFIIGIVGIIISIICWRFAYSSVRKYNKYAKSLYNIDFLKEGSCNEFQKIAEKMFKLEKQDEKIQINFENRNNQKEKIPYENVVACLYNMLRNIYEMYGDEVNK